MYNNIEKITIENKNYRQVIHTTNEQQLVLMSLEPKEFIPMETHAHTTQFFRVEQGTGIAIVKNKTIRLRPNSFLIVPPNTKHYIKQTGKQPLKLYTIYSPPEHPQDRVQERQEN